MTSDNNAENVPEPDIDEELAPSRTMGTRAPRERMRRFTVLAFLSGKKPQEEVFDLAHRVLDVSGGGAKMSVFPLKTPKSRSAPAMWAAMFTVRTSAVNEVLRELHHVAISVSLHGDLESAHKAMRDRQYQHILKELGHKGVVDNLSVPERAPEVKEKKRKKAKKAGGQQMRSWEG